ncbi:NUDIX domain-containing protein [Pseudanabaena sp. FACHB-1998]|uniref:NUDIX hydrolase n=1 Tax=Pseudanabaena sp. FACHB-1998 TaxID=2692858 RepID=UPI00168140E9|nr:NUDIX domain-containing protein [Pseudanabaena sp. FACHB-1998]MBD2175812.1 NUDIX domain-containing protein [Pseudanabaena sp. FACHB-1998]
MNKIGCKAMCVCSYKESILVARGEDSQNGAIFYRPLGGSIEFGETSQNAIIREIKEEIGADLIDVKLLGVLESLFDFEGERGHEVVFIYDAQLVDKKLYAEKTIIGQETDGSEIVATWQKLDYFVAQGRLVPEGLLDLLTR